MKRLLVAVTTALLIVLGVQAPAQADPAYDFELSASATVNTTTIPSIITWHLSVDSIGDNMGTGAAQEGTIEFTAPASISLVLSDDCDTTGNSVTCYWYVEDGIDDFFEVNGLVALTATGTITVVPTMTIYPSRIDIMSSNDSVTVTCTAVTSVLVTC